MALRPPDAVVAGADLFPGSGDDYDAVDHGLAGIVSFMVVDAEAAAWVYAGSAAPADDDESIPVPAGTVNFAEHDPMVLVGGRSLYVRAQAAASADGRILFWSGRPYANTWA